MADSNLPPGNKVVDLTLLLRSSAVLAGAAAAAISLKHTVLWILMAAS